MKIMFMGTPDFSVKALEKLAEYHDVAAVITQPDKAKGRSGKLTFPPVKEKALELGIDVYQPQRVKDPAFMDILEKINPEVIVVIAFGQILPQSILDYPKYGCINVHASLLPKYRGSAPIQWAVINGEEKTGVTTMKMDIGVDTGDIIDMKELVLDPKETGGSLFDRLMYEGADLIIETLDKLEKGTATFTKQDDSQSTHAQMLSKQIGNLDFSKSAVELERLIRGLNPWPSAYTSINGKTLKIWDADVCDDNEKFAPGTIFGVDGKKFKISTAQGALIINELQLEGKKRMKTEDFLRGYKLEGNPTLNQ